MNGGRKLHKQTKATGIPEKVKKAVYERDNGRCIVCFRHGNPWCHYIPRSQGGLGIEENIVTLCDSCHKRFDQTADRKHLRAYISGYLKKKYPRWDEAKLIYKKGM